MMSLRESATSKTVLLLGAGGHSKVVLTTLREAGLHVEAILDDDPQKTGSSLMDVPVLDLAQRRPQEGEHAVLGVGDNRQRQQLAERFPQAIWESVIHPRAIVHPSARLHPGTVVFAGAVIQADARLGAHTIVNTGTTVDHDCRIADFAHLAPGTHLAGHVHVGEGVLMGIGSCAAPRVRIGAWTTVGAGGVVVADLPQHVTALGVPARPV